MSCFRQPVIINNIEGNWYDGGVCNSQKLLCQFYEDNQSSFNKLSTLK